MHLQEGRLAWQIEGLAAEYRPDQVQIPPISAWGAYAQGVYRLSPYWDIAARYKAFDPGTSGPIPRALHWTTLGASWRIHGDREKVLADLVCQQGGGQPTDSKVWVIQYQRYLF